MGYSEAFINEIKELYPNSPNMVEMARNGNHFVGRYLDDNSSGGISIDTILLATSLQEIQEKARLAKRRVQLYRKWGEEYDRIRGIQR